MDKNRNRERASFANINLLGRCNQDCFFCLGKDIECLLNQHNQMSTHFSEWLNLDQFLGLCFDSGIRKLYLTGQNTDPLLYPWLGELIDYLQEKYNSFFNVGIRTNGLLALKKMDIIGKCREEIGYTVLSLTPMCFKMIVGRSDIPDWDKILPETKARNVPLRVSIVINRCNYHEFWEILRYLAKFNLPYVQVRRVSTDTRQKELAPDINAYEMLYTEVSRMFPLKERLWTDAEVYNIFGANVVFWRTTKTSISSYNYFSEGTISAEYFIVEGYVKNSETAKKDGFVLPAQT